MKFSIDYNILIPAGPTRIQDLEVNNKAVKAVLGNLAMISQGMAELRNLYGTGHGKHARHKSLPVRHARLVVGAATTLAVFLFETHAEHISGAKLSIKTVQS